MQLGTFRLTYLWLCKFTSKGHFYPKNKFQEFMKKNMNVLHTEMQGYYISNKFKFHSRKFKLN